MNKTHKLLTIAGLTIACVLPAHAVECLDPALTRVITRAMGRVPQAGECNAKLYGTLPADEAVGSQYVKEVLTAVYGAGTAKPAQATQKLPLRKKMSVDLGQGMARFPGVAGV
jgi:hypothetical protein